MVIDGYSEPYCGGSDCIQSKGELNYVICELTGQLISKSRISYEEISKWITAIEDAADELRRRLLHPYEDAKRFENGDVHSINEILKVINIMVGEIKS